MRPLHPWTTRVHAAMLKTGRPMTSREIVAEFGPPAGKQKGCDRLSAAARKGYFTKVKFTPAGNVYTAVEHEQYNVWSREMKRLLADHYPTMGSGCMVFFPRLTRNAVQKKAFELGITMAGRAPIGSDLAKGRRRKRPPKAPPITPIWRRYTSVWHYAQEIAA